MTESAINNTNITDTNTDTNIDLETGDKHEVILTEDDASNADNGETSNVANNNDTIVDATASSTDDSSRSDLIKKLLIALLLVTFVVFVIIDSLTNGYIRDGLQSFLEWIQDNPAAGFFVFMVVYMFATVFFVPGSILTLGAGFVFANAFGLGLGVLVGSLAVFIGASVGAIASFLLGRFLLRDWVSNTLTAKYALFKALDVALEEKGFRIMSLLRLSPIVPFNAINYIAGVTAISFWSYVWAMMAILPGTILYVFLGASAGSLADSASSGSNSTVTLVVVVVGVVFGIGAIAVTSYYAKAELNKVIAEREGEQADDCKEDDMEVGSDNSEDRTDQGDDTPSPQPAPKCSLCTLYK